MRHASRRRSRGTARPRSPPRAGRSSATAPSDGASSRPARRASGGCRRRERRGCRRDHGSPRIRSSSCHGHVLVVAGKTRGRSGARAPRRSAPARVLVGEEVGKPLPERSQRRNGRSSRRNRGGIPSPMNGRPSRALSRRRVAYQLSPLPSPSPSRSCMPATSSSGARRRRAGADDGGAPTTSGAGTIFPLRVRIRGVDARSHRPTRSRIVSPADATGAPARTCSSPIHDVDGRAARAVVDDERHRAPWLCRAPARSARRAADPDHRTVAARSGGARRGSGAA